MTLKVNCVLLFRMVTKRQLLTRLKKPVYIAGLFGVTKQAVSAWPMDTAIPELQEKRLRYEIKPDWFDERGLFICGDEREIA